MTSEEKPSARERWLKAGVVVGIAMVVVPFVVSLVGIANVSRGPEGLRGATHHPELQRKVGFALGTTSVLVFLAFPGVVLGVSCGLTLAEDRRKREDARAASRSGPPRDDQAR